MSLRKRHGWWGATKLIIPTDSCHEIVGRSYQEQVDYQKGLVVKLLTGKHEMPALPEEEPTAKFWEEIRKAGTHADIKQDSSRANPTTTTSTSMGLGGLLSITPIGQAVVSYLWAMNTITVGHLASASKQCNDAVAVYVSRFHLPLGDYQDCDWLPLSLLDMADGRKRTIGIGKCLFVKGRDEFVWPAQVKGVPNIWTSDASRRAMVQVADDHANDEQVYVRLLPFLKNNGLLYEKEKLLADAQNNSEVTIAANSEDHKHLREISYTVPLLRSLYQWGQHLQAVRFHDVPLMNISIVEIVLSALPGLEVIGLANCELLHIAHVIPLIDIVHRNSKQHNKRPVMLEFFPRMWKGSEQNRDGTYVISWEPLAMRIPSAVLATVLVAVIKSYKMEIDLCGKDRSFRKFLELVPMKLGAAATFIHHLFTWIDASTNKQVWDGLTNQEREDLENQVLLAVLQSEKNGVDYCFRNSYSAVYKCCRCGYSMVAALFRMEMKEWMDNQRICRCCDLMHVLENQSHHRLWEKHNLITSLLHSARGVKRRQSEEELQRELPDVVAPPMPNPFVWPLGLGSRFRREALEISRNLPSAEVLGSLDREYELLSVSGLAAMLDTEDKIAMTKGLFYDDPKYTTQGRSTSKGRKGSWEYILWHEVHRAEALEANGGKPAGFW
ncbi:hypothetical protein C8034_v010853 [Colletotrichum sidae]|uniref:Uncharacterized protein n=1 Tax=Colletotrichum sidae TaxID=1347389 RepID=A0A4R8TL08_9PEZI|nr:hypothetical protein C8034_v010853 [Colletotrichum sidae]